MKPHCSFALLFLCMLVLPVQAKDVADTPSSESNDSPLVSDLSVDQFSEVVKRIVQQTLEECTVEGDMEGKAKLIERPSLAILASLVDANPCRD